MPSAISKKLRIKDGFSLLTLNAPDNFKKEVNDAGVKFTTSSGNYNQIHWFVQNKSQMEKELKNVLPLLKEDILCWIYYPKGSSKMQTDLTRDKGWELLLGNKDLQWISLISFNDIWSAFAIRRLKESDKKKEATKEKRAILDYIDPNTKTIRLPEDFEKELKKKSCSSLISRAFHTLIKKNMLNGLCLQKKMKRARQELKSPSKD